MMEHYRRALEVRHTPQAGAAGSRVLGGHNTTVPGTKTAIFDACHKAHGHQAGRYGAPHWKEKVRIRIYNAQQEWIEGVVHHDYSQVKKSTGDKKFPITDWYHVFATNLPVKRAFLKLKNLPEEYRVSVEETAYRQPEKIRPRTTSRRPTYRMILFYTLMFMRNIWRIKRTETDKRPSLRLRAVICAVLYAAKTAAFQFGPGGGRARRSAKQCCCKCGRPLA